MTTSYSDFRARLAELWDLAVDDRETITVTRRGKENLVVLPERELSGLLETLHLLSSPRNAERLLSAIDRSNAGSDDFEVVDVNELRRQIENGTYSAEATAERV